jgi:hypothetical protein
MKRQFVIQKPAKPRPESKKHKKPVILVRRDYQEDMMSFTTALVISGSVLRNALRHIFRGAAGFTLTESDSTEVCGSFGKRMSLMISSIAYTQVHVLGSP